MLSARAEDFAEFFAAGNDGRAPFPWQTRLVNEAAARAEVGESRLLPDLLDLPTGAGKTSILDVVVFLQALDAARPPEQRRVPRRTVFVVDRRVVVDQVDAHARSLGQRLRAAVAAPGILGEVARALQSLHGSDREPPLRVGSLRGGIVRDETWARRPDTPVVLTSTVDQVGSRLLFRGYGVSDGIKPIHAGLLGTDTLFVLDEVHLAVPFAQTLGMIGSRYRARGTVALPARWQVMHMSATAPLGSIPVRFNLGDADRDPRAAPALVRRLGARKPAGLVAGSGSGDAAFARLAAAQVSEMLEGGLHRTVLVVANRVSRAVASWQLLSERARGTRPGALQGARVELVTGRMRAVERAAVLDRITPWVACGTPAPEAPLIVVATQAVEAGADFDFDALVTECASLDALRQRFGRVDRLGSCAERGITARGAVIGLGGEVKDTRKDPVYGTALAATWAALVRSGDGQTIDFGAGFPPDLDQDSALLPSRPQAPYLFAEHVEAWSQTSPIPDPDPDPGLWLHGLDPSDPDVSLVWRADVTADLLAAASADPDQLASLIEHLTALPPGPSETLALPASQVRCWLHGAHTPQLADADAAPAPEADTEAVARTALAWRGEFSTVVIAGQIRPGDVLVVPATYGGVGVHGSWTPDATDPVPDVAEVDQIGPLRARPVLRINDLVLGLPVPGALDGETLSETAERLRAFCTTALDSPAADSWSPALRRSADVVARSRGARLAISRGPRGWVVSTRYRLDTRAVDIHSEVDETSEGSSFAAVRVSLRDHTEGVSAQVRQTAANCGLPLGIVEDLELAARLHDIGKLDPRFQALLAYPDPAPVEPLGKSAHGSDRRLRAAARAMSGLPRGFDHAVTGAAICDHHPDLVSTAHDRDLVLHLLAAHHGQCRPFARPVPDTFAEPIRVQWAGTLIDVPATPGGTVFDPGPAERFFRVQQRYGWYGLAWLEAILRLGDWYRSEQEQIGGEK